MNTTATPDPTRSTANETDGPTIRDVERWLRTVRPRELGDVVVRSVERLSRGVSRETWEITLSDPSLPAPSVRRIVMRRDLHGGSIDASDLRQEYEVYRCLAATRVPAMPVILYDDDPDRCPQGRPAYLRHHVPGHWLPAAFTSDQPPRDRAHQRIEVCRSHVEALAEVHAVDWRAAGLDAVLPVPTRPTDAARALIDLHTSHLHDAAFEPHPMVTYAIHRLRRSAPPAEELCLLKGTNGLGEEIFDGDVMVAMSDWELAAIGDPAYDFAQLQGFADRIEVDGQVRWDLERALDHYRTVTGRTIDPAAVRWYRHLYGLIMFTFAHRAARSLIEGHDLQARRAWVAVEMQHHGQARLAAACRLRVRRPTTPDPAGMAAEPGSSPPVRTDDDATNAKHGPAAVPPQHTGGD